MYLKSPSRNGLIVLLLASLFFLMTHILPADETDNRVTVPESGYYCPPCGCPGDHKIVASEENCDQCGMKLIKKECGLTGQTAKLLSGVFRQSEINTVYYDRLMYPAFIAGLLLSVVMLLKSRQNRANLFLALLTVAFSLYPFQNRMMCISQQLTDSAALVFFPFSFILAIGPSTYFYTRSYADPEFKASLKDMLHFLPVFFVMSVYVFYFLKPPAEKHAIYLTPEVISLSNYEQVLGILLGLIYLYYSFKFVQRQQATLKRVPRKGRQFAWLKKLILILSIFLFGWFGVLVVNKIFFDFGISHLTYYPVWGGIALLLYGICLMCLLRPQLIFANSNGKNNGIRLEVKDRDLNARTAKLLDVMRLEQPYLDPELDLNKLADLMDIKPKQLTFLLNYRLNKSFYDFVNEYRVERVKQELLNAQNEHLTILAIAYESGFNSKSTFNALFKKHVTMTPMQFRKRYRRPSC